MSILYYRDKSGENVRVMLNEIDAYAQADRSVKSAAPPSSAEFGTKVTRAEAVELVGEDHVVSAENHVRNAGGPTPAKP